MSDGVSKKVEGGLRRCLGAILGLLLGLLLGAAAGLLLFGFGDPLLVSIGVGGLLGAVVCFFWPGPILFVAELLLDVLRS